MSLSFSLERVGDGLCGAMHQKPGHGLQLDIGGESQEAAWRGFRNLHRPELLVVSHFHYDHYCGLYAGARETPKPLDVSQVLFPRLPDFSQRAEFGRAYLSMLFFVLGGTTGSIPLDFLELVRSVNLKPFAYSPLSLGQTFSSEGNKYSVLWPPERYEAQHFVGSVRDALKSYDNALEEDEDLKAIDKLMKSKENLAFLASDEGKLSSHEGSPPPAELRRKLAPSAFEAISKLTRVANRVSLAFSLGEDLLFLGDLESQELGTVAQTLVNDGRDFYRCIVSAHHGTHWHEALAGIRTTLVANSAGYRRYRRYCTEYDTISRLSLTTHHGPIRFSFSDLDRLSAY